MNTRRTWQKPSASSQEFGEENPPVELDFPDMSRTTLILGLLQLALVIVGFTTLGIVLKFCGYPREDLGVIWNDLPVLLREHGGWLMLLPVLWVCYATNAQRLDRGLFSYRLACMIGLSIVALIIALFFYAAVFPFTRPIFIGL